METLRDLLEKEAKQSCWYEEGDKITDELLEEVLRELPVVWEGNRREHRWRVDYDLVYKIMDGDEERFFEATSCDCTGDNSAEDCGYTFEGIDNIPEVFPEQVTTTVYK